MKFVKYLVLIRWIEFGIDPIVLSSLPVHFTLFSLCGDQNRYWGKHQTWRVNETEGSHEMRKYNRNIAHIVYDSHMA